jgi:hypothetical protein
MLSIISMDSENSTYLDSKSFLLLKFIQHVQVVFFHYRIGRLDFVRKCNYSAVNWGMDYECINTYIFCFILDM